MPKKMINNRPQRPAKCLFCHERLYEEDHPKFKPEIILSTVIHLANHKIPHNRKGLETHYAHLECWDKYINVPAPEPELLKIYRDYVEGKAR